MAIPADWIKVGLTPAEVARAEETGQRQRDYAISRGFKAKGHASVETHVRGFMGELAVARYEGVERDRDWTWEADRRRGYDVARWQVRTSSRLGLRLNRGDHGQFIHVFAPPGTVLWLVGSIPAVEGFKLAVPQIQNGYTWYRVDPKDLHPLPAKNGYAPQGNHMLVDPQTPFWCEECHGVHPIIEHRECRTLRPVENSARQQLLTTRARRVTSQLYPPERES